MARIPAYHIENRGPVRSVQRFANNIANSGSVNIGTIAANALNAAADIFDDKAMNAENVIQQAYFEKSSMNVENGLAELAEKHKFDPEGFNKEVDEQRSNYLGAVPPKHAAEYALMFDKYKNRYYQHIEKNQLQIQENNLKASFLEANQKHFKDAVNSARLGNLEQLEENVNKYITNRKMLFANGMISPEAFVRMGEELDNEIELQTNLGQFDKVMPLGDEAVVKYLKDFAARTDINIGRRDRIAAAMAGEYNSFKAKNAVVLKEYRKQADFAIEAINKGIIPQIDLISLGQMLKAGGDVDTAKKLQTAIDLSDDVKIFSGLAPEQMKIILDENKNNISTPFELARFKAYAGTFNEAVKGLAEDPLNFAISHNLIENGQFDLTNPEEVEKRINNGRFLQEKYHLSYAPLITEAEGKLLAQTVSNNDFASNAVLLGLIYNNFSEDAEQIFQKIAPKNPEFAQAASVFPFNPDAAVGILQGVSILKNQKEFKPGDDEDFNKAYYEQIGFDVFSGLNPEDQNNIKQSVRAYAAKLNRDKNITDNTISTHTIEKAVHDVVGNIVKIDRDGWFNGDIITVTPQNVSADDFENWFVNLKDEDLQGAVTADGYTVSSDNLKENGSLLWVGDKKYQIRIKDRLLYNKDGTLFILKYEVK